MTAGHRRPRRSKTRSTGTASGRGFEGSGEDFFGRAEAVYGNDQ